MYIIEYLLILDCCQTNKAKCKCRLFLRSVSLILTDPACKDFSVCFSLLFGKAHFSCFTCFLFVVFDMIGCNISQMLALLVRQKVFNLRHNFYSTQYLYHTLKKIKRRLSFAELSLCLRLCSIVNVIFKALFTW